MEVVEFKDSSKSELVVFPNVKQTLRKSLLHDIIGFETHIRVQSDAVWYLVNKKFHVNILRGYYVEDPSILHSSVLYFLELCYKESYTDDVARIFEIQKSFPEDVLIIEDPDQRSEYLKFTSNG